MDSKALTKIQSVALIAIIVVAAVGGGAAYVLWSGPAQSAENIRIGVCADLDMPSGQATWRGVILAAEQINAEGGILGRNITVVAEDDESATTIDVAVAINALTRLITADKADYVIANGGDMTITMPYQDICCDNKKIIITVVANNDNVTQRVLDNYDKYKYYFRTMPPNTTTISAGVLGDIITVGKYTGFTKIALLFQDGNTGRALASTLSKTLPNNGFRIVYSNFFSKVTTDFASYFAAIEATGAEILVPYITGQGGISFVKEWYDRQSPFVVWGVLMEAQESNFWNLTEGKCDTVSTNGLPAISGYPLTNKTLTTHDAYIKRWGEVPTQSAVGAYDTLRFILPDALKRAGTTETEAVIKALERTNVETSCARHFVFTSSHDVMVGSGAVNDPAERYTVMCIFQWQNGTQVPVKPEAIMEEAGATYKYPLWDGPWDNTPTP